jgi:hypothetical protein
MKHLLISLMTIGSLFSLAAQADTLKGETDAAVTAWLVDGYQSIPSTGALTGNVISVYAGSAVGLENYVVTVGNNQAPCEGDDCLVNRTFTVRGNYKGAAKAVYSRQIDASNYSIAIMTTVVSGQNNDGSLIVKPAKVLLRVKLTKDGVAETAVSTDAQ